MRQYQSVVSKIPGIMVCIVIALSTGFLSENYGGPQLLYALLIGLSLHFLYSNEHVRPGIDFSSKTILRVGVALLGIRITFGDISEIGFSAAAIVVFAVATTVALGAVLARTLGFSRDFGLIAGGSVGICGASAALAVASVLPKTKANEQFTLLVVVGVTVLSTIAMVVYPFILQMLDIGSMDAGIFIGTTIHDVAQVVAAGMLFGPEAGDVSTVVKLFRVALLLPVVLVISVLFASQSAGKVGLQSFKLIPLFLIGFVALSLIASMKMVSPGTIETVSGISRWMLVIAIAAAGLKTNFQELAQLGWKPVILLVLETLYIALVAAGLMLLL